MSSFPSGVPQLASVADTLPYYAPHSFRIQKKEYDAFGVTDVGRVRERNEDQFVIAELSRHAGVEQSSLAGQAGQRLCPASEAQVFAVADGMGGHEDGQEASALVLQVMLEHVAHHVPWPGSLGGPMDEIVLDVLSRGLETCQERLKALASSHGTARRKPGSTLTLTYLVWPTLYLLHVGDSRCYLHRDAKLVRLTSDHTMAQLLMDPQSAGKQKAETPLANVLLQAVGAGEERIEPELTKLLLRDGDTLLLCSDGLTAEMDDDALSHELSAVMSAKECSQRLVEAANRAGGRDNVTALVVRL